MIRFISTYKHDLSIYSAFSCIYYSLFIDFSPCMLFSRWLNCFYNATPLIVFTPLHTCIKCTGQIMYFHLAPLFIHLCCLLRFKLKFKLKFCRSLHKNIRKKYHRSETQVRMLQRCKVFHNLLSSHLVCNLKKIIKF